MTKKPALDLNQYEEVTALGAAYTEGLMRIWEKLGQPSDVTTNTGWVMLDNIVAVWQKGYPHEVADWKHDRDIDLGVERSVQEHVKGGGYNPITYPPRLYQMIKAMLPDVNLSDKKFMKALAQRHPLFKTTNLHL